MNTPTGTEKRILPGGAGSLAGWLIPTRGTQVVEKGFGNSNLGRGPATSTLPGSTRPTLIDNSRLPAWTTKQPVVQLQRPNDDSHNNSQPKSEVMSYYADSATLFMAYGDSNLLERLQAT